MNTVRFLWLRRALIGVVAVVASGVGVVVTSTAPAHASGCGGAGTIFTATADNTSGDMITLDDSNLNGRPEVAPIVTQLYTGQYDTHPVGTWYSYTGQWTIFNEDGADIPLGTSFNVVSLCPAPPYWMEDRFTATSSNTQGDAVFIDSPASNGNSQAFVYASQVWTGTYNPHEIGVYYQPGSGWWVYNLDHSPMPIGASFNVLSYNTGSSLYSGGYPNLTVTASASNTVDGYMVYINDPEFNGNPGLQPIVSQDFIDGPCFPYIGCPGVTNNHPVGVWYNSRLGQWVIYNVDGAAIPAGATFFVDAL